jgi:L-2-hydroxyglutarate oxidase LhgO
VKRNADYLICGGGIVGLTLARGLLSKGCEDIVIIEKEESLGKHASGRNSGVLHAGIYYGADSFRAKSCLNGNLLMRQYCKEKGLPLSESGKVIVACNAHETEMLRKLRTRAEENGAKVELIDEKQLSEIEPNAKTHDFALYSPYTAVVEPKEILKSLYDEIMSSGKVRIFFKTEFVGIRESNTVVTNKGEIQFRTFINAAGAHGDKIAHAFGVGMQYRIIPFKGIYRKLIKRKSHLVRGNIYPVADTRNPFLGVHFTRDIKGDVYIGPTAIPAFGRENYEIFRGIDSEVYEILCRDAFLFFADPGFREIALQEPKKYFFRYFFRDARRLLKELSPGDVSSSDKVGIRPQLVDWARKELVMDYVIIKDGSSIHLLNTISPAFTSSMDFSQFIVNEYCL